ncbi:UNVERIFIED_CONTAM: hypothetical protein Slati_0615400 [Sesamum latifolium]|uniref:Uncharacterized protein n=1 Tax=Sesamum latifolium TaxID=2727402 RepID=A0AAW2Y2D5_9LAMI
MLIIRGPPKVTQHESSDCGISETNSNVYHKGEDEISGRQQHEWQALPHQANSGEIQNNPMCRIEGHGEDDQEGNSREIQARDIVAQKDQYHGRNLSHRSDTVGQSLQDAKTKLDKEKLKATFERRKARGVITQTMGPGGDENEQKHKLSHGNDFDAVEEGEVEPSDDTERGYQSPSPSIRQKKAGSPSTSEENAIE